MQTNSQKKKKKKNEKIKYKLSTKKGPSTK